MSEVIYTARVSVRGHVLAYRIESEQSVVERDERLTVISTREESRNRPGSFRQTTAVFKNWDYHEVLVIEKANTE